MAKPDDIRQADWDAAVVALCQEDWTCEPDMYGKDAVWHTPGDIEVSSIEVEPIARAIASARVAGAIEATERMEGVLVRYIDTVVNAEGTDFIEGGLYRDAAETGPDDPVLFRCSGRNERGRVTPEAEAITAAIRARRP